MIGTTGEERAAFYLESLGYTILARNFRTRFGELDVIVQDNKTIVFVEVKTRSNTLFGSPAEAITSHKLKKLIASAHIYLSSKNLTSHPFRFDAVEVFDSEINHIKNITV